MAPLIETPLLLNGARPSMPIKTREIHNHHMNSTVWNDVKLRPDDIIISTWAKSGTTWMQQIVSQLVNSGDPTVSSGSLSPWVDLRIVPREAMLQGLEAQTHRRFMKTHLPLEGMVWDPKVKYIFVGRDMRDAIWSLYNHFAVATDAFYAMINDTPGRVGPPILRPSAGPREMFLDFLEDDTRQTLPWPFWSHFRSWWAARNQPNILFVHFNDLKADMEGEIRRIASFLDISNISDETWKAIVEHCTFAWMKEHADLAAPPQAEIAWENGAKSFINKGTNGRWKDVLSEEDNLRYIQKADRELGPECARWLQNGRLQ